MSSNPAHGEVYSIQHYGIKFLVTCDRSVVFFGYSGFLHQWNLQLKYNWNIVESDVKHPNPINPKWNCLFLSKLTYLEIIRYHLVIQSRKQWQHYLYMYIFWYTGISCSCRAADNGSKATCNGRGGNWSWFRIITTSSINHPWSVFSRKGLCARQSKNRILSYSCFG